VRRRQFIAFVGGLSLAWPSAAPAQQRERLRQIGVLMGYAETDADTRANLAALREGLQELDWAEGRNVRINIRWPIPADLGSMQRSAKELVELQPDLLLSEITPTTAALLQQTHTIPIVFVRVSDPVGSGFVASFAEPGGNVTGFTSIEPTMPTKWLQLLKEIAPRVDRVTVLFNPATAPYAAEFFLKPIKTAASSLAIEVITAPVRDTSDMEAVIVKQAGTPNGSLLALPDSFMDVHRMEVASLAARYHLAAVYPFHQFCEAGGLLSYGNDQIDNYRRAAAYVDRILRGAKPSELPVQAPVKFKLVINQRAANALGLTVPPSLLARADEVIE
jgi:putative ABC transport system substrate-binding protein